MLVSEMTNNLVRKALEGDTVEVVAALKKMSKACDAAVKNKDVNSAIEKELQRGAANAFRMKLEWVPVKTEYDYSNCNHPGLTAALEIKKTLDIYIKEVQESLKRVTSNAIMTGKAGQEVVVEDIPVLSMQEHGEFVRVHPPAKLVVNGLKTTELK